jgi:NAD(P)-dependent dehydrogenase (short-subunit alcohol dehydrogenase family)
MAEAFLDNVALSERKQILNISSILASMEVIDGCYYPYRATKSALNAVMKSLAADVADRGVTVVLFHPGWARTGMGGPDADISADESVSALRPIFEKLTPADGGKWINYTGEIMPW